MPYWKIDLAWVADQMGLLPCRTFCECAIGPMDISVSSDFMGRCKRSILIEPHPGMAATAASCMQTEIIRVAVGFSPGVRTFIDNGGSSYLDGTWAPTPVQSIQKTYQVGVVTFDSLDDGEIDVLALDCEGMEWAVLSKMKSRPELMTIEIWEQNPWRKEIFWWIKENHYVLRFATGPTAETHLYTRAHH